MCYAYSSFATHYIPQVPKDLEAMPTDDLGFVWRCHRDAQFSVGCMNMYCDEICRSYLKIKDVYRVAEQRGL